MECVCHRFEGNSTSVPFIIAFSLVNVLDPSHPLYPQSCKLPARRQINNTFMVITLLVSNFILTHSRVKYLRNRIGNRAQKCLWTCLSTGVNAVSQMVHFSYL